MEEVREGKGLLEIEDVELCVVKSVMLGEPDTDELGETIEHVKQPSV